MSKNKVEKHFDEIARDYDYYKSKNAFYYQNLKKLLSSLIPSGKNVLEIGCGTGDLLNHIRPKTGVGYDLSSVMIKIAQSKFKYSHNLSFSISWPSNKFDYIFMSDVVEHLEDPNETFKKISRLMDSNTKLIITMANPIWEPFLLFAEKLGLKMPEGPHKRLTFEDLRFMIHESGMKVVKHNYTLLIPIKIPFITYFSNKYLERYLKPLCFLEYFVIVKA